MSCTPFLVFMVEIAAKATVILTLATAAAFATRRASAAVRHFIWLLGFGAIGLLPLLSMALPSWRPGFLTLLESRESRAPAAVSFVPLEGEAPPARLGQVESIAAKKIPQGGSIWPEVFAALWAAGTIACLSRLGMGHLTVWKLARSGLEPSPSLEKLFEHCRQQMQVHGPVRLLLGPTALGTPMTAGIRHPFVLLPVAAATWENERLEMVLVHELAHIRRRDWIGLLASAWSCAFFWFHPVVWLAARRLRFEGERAADDCVLALGVKASAYGRQLLAIAEFARKFDVSLDGRRVASIVASMARRTGIEDRIRAILDRGRDRRGLVIWQALLGMTLCVALALLVGSFEVRAVETEVGSIHPILAIAGDSTAAPYDSIFPYRGWPQYLPDYLQNLNVLNEARPGRSSRTFLSEGHWGDLLKKKPKFVLIQFGLNDAHFASAPEAVDPQIGFPKALKEYIDTSEAGHVIPILVTPVHPRLFDETGRLIDVLQPYAAATHSVAAERHVALVDLYAETGDWFAKLGPEKCRAFDPVKNDHNHLNAPLAKAIAAMVMHRLPEVEPRIRPYLKDHQGASD